MKSGEKNGNAINYYSNGDFYKGNFRNGLREGKGTYFWKSGSSWKGSCDKGQLHGEGLYKNADDGKETQISFDYGNIVWEEIKVKVRFNMNYLGIIY